MVIIRCKNEETAAARRDMNRIGFALIFVILLQWLISIAIYIVIVTRSGTHITFYGFTPQQILKTIMQIRKAAAAHIVSSSAALFFATLIANTLPFYLCLRACGIKLKSVFSRPQIDGGTVVLYGVVALGASELTSMLVSTLASLLKLVHLKLTTPSFNIPWKSPLGTVLMITAAVILAPLTEEFICRGVLLRVFRRYGDIFAVVASSLVWALLHGNFVQGIPVFILGLFFGMLALRSGSILPTFLIHAFNNSLALFSTSALHGSIEARLAEVSISLTILLLSIVLFPIYYKKFVIKDKGRPAKGFAIFFTCVPILLVILFCAYTTVLSVKPV